MDNSSNTPQPAPQGPAPQAPINVEKTVKTGWILFTVAVLVTLVGLYFGVALAASALIFAFAGRLGLQAKNKPLAITALVFCGITLLLFIIAYFGSN